MDDAAATRGFLARAFGGAEVLRHLDDAGAIRHAEMRIDDAILAVGEGAGAATPASTHVYKPHVDACHARALQVGAAGVVAPRDLPYGDRSAGTRDAQGNLSWIGSHHRA